MINWIKRCGIGLTDFVSELADPHDELTRPPIPPPFHPPLPLCLAEKDFFDELKTRWNNLGLFIYNRPLPHEELDFGDQALWHGVALATLVWKYQVEPTDELLAMQERAASGLMFLFDRARTDGQLLLVRGRRDDGELRDEVSNDSCTGFFFGAYYLARLGAPHLREKGSGALSVLALELIRNNYALINRDGKPTKYGKLVDGILTAPPLATLCMAIMLAAAQFGTPETQGVAREHFNRLWKKYGRLVDLSEFKFLWLTKTHEAHRAAMNLHVLAEMMEREQSRDGYHRCCRGLDRILKLERKAGNWWIVALAAQHRLVQLHGSGDMLRAISRLQEFGVSERYVRVEKRNSLDAAKWKAHGIRFVKLPNDKLHASQPLPIWAMGQQDFMPQRDLFSVDDNIGETSPHWRYSGLDFLAPYWLLRLLDLIEPDD